MPFLIVSVDHLLSMSARRFAAASCGRVSRLTLAHIVRDEEAVRLEDGDPIPNTEAYYWQYSVPLAMWKRELALTNVENYVMFAMAVQLYEYGWDFSSGYAVRVE